LAADAHNHDVRRLVAAVVMLVFASLIAIDGICCSEGCTHEQGFAPATASVHVSPGTTQEIIVELQPQPTVDETVTVVASTRTDKRLEDQPIAFGA
jgi:hypothetical protein